MGKPTEDYRAARRNEQRGFVWTGIQSYYRPVASKGKTYRPNGDQERWRRRRRLIQQARAAA